MTSTGAECEQLTAPVNSTQPKSSEHQHSKTRTSSNQVSLAYPYSKLRQEYILQHSLRTSACVFIAFVNLLWMVYLVIMIGGLLGDKHLLKSWRVLAILVPFVCLLVNIGSVLAIYRGHVRWIEIAFIVNGISLILHIPMVIALRKIFYLAIIGALFQTGVLFFNYKSLQLCLSLEKDMVEFVCAIRKNYINRANSIGICCCLHLRKVSIVTGILKVLTTIAFLVLVCAAPSINYAVLVAAYAALIIDALGLYGIYFGNSKYILCMFLSLIAITVLWISPLVADQSVINIVNAGVVVFVQCVFAFVFWKCHALLKSIQAQDWAVLTDE